MKVLTVLFVTERFLLAHKTVSSKFYLRANFLNQVFNCQHCLNLQSRIFSRVFFLINQAVKNFFTCKLFFCFLFPILLATSRTRFCHPSSSVNKHFDQFFCFSTTEKRPPNIIHHRTLQSVNELHQTATQSTNTSR